jgi:predicted metalloprotease with PDZ domain
MPIAYHLAVPHPATHYLTVTLHIWEWDQEVLDLKLPVWTPGSYLVREYARHLEQFQVQGGLAWQKVSKNHWQIRTPGVSEIQVQYGLYANELSVRTNYVDEQLVLIHGAATFLYIPRWRYQASDIVLVPACPDWLVATALEPVAKNHFRASDYDTLVDSPILMGQLTIYDFWVQNVPHQLAVAGRLTCDADALIQDLTKIMTTEAALFGGLPYERYLFLLHLTHQGYGGLEHKNCCALIYSQAGMGNPQKYQKFLNLVAHEFFHVWNVKRLQPVEFIPYDYDREQYTTSLWFCEGTTSYYDLVMPWRAGIYDAHRFLELLGEEITRYYQTPGREVQSLSEASWDAWIKYYRRDANSPNSQISYYLKGALVTLLLDLKIRKKFANQRSFDDVMQRMWQEFGRPGIGFTPEQLQATVVAVLAEDVTDFWQHYITGLTPLPLAEYLADFGLALQPIPEPKPFLGITLEPGRCVVKQVVRHSPAWWAGIDPGDELVTLAGQRVRRERWPEQLRALTAGQTVTLSVFRQEEWRQYTVTLGEPVPERYQIVPMTQRTPDQERLGTGWLGPTVFGDASCQEP